MPKNPSTPLHDLSAPEICDFDEGFKRIRERISQLLDEKDDVVMAISGSAPNVGKTSLSNKVFGSFFVERVPVGVCANFDDFVTAAMNVELYRQRFCSKKSLYILEAMGAPHGLKEYKGTHIRAAYDSRFNKTAGDFWLDLKKIDVWAAIYRSDKPFHMFNERVGKDYDPFEDVVICNTLARGE